MPVPSQERVVELLGDLVRDRGYDLEDVNVVAAGKHSAVRIMVDREDGVDLDALPDLSRVISDVFDRDIPTSGPLFEELSRIAASTR